MLPPLQPFRGWGHTWPGHFLPTDRVNHWSRREHEGFPLLAGSEFQAIAPPLPEVGEMGQGSCGWAIVGLAAFTVRGCTAGRITALPLCSMPSDCARIAFHPATNQSKPIFLRCRGGSGARRRGTWTSAGRSSMPATRRAGHMVGAELPAILHQLGSASSLAGAAAHLTC